MKISESIGYILLVGIFTICIHQTQQLASNNKNGNKYPSYSLHNMPNTDFTCRGKILGGYYADAETQCQMFHICVKIAGVGVQDFRFLCPNGTAFDQEAQTCADFGDVDCEQATLFYGSDNFDLYRIGSGFDSSKRPTPATEDESTFHLQRAESNDLRRSKQPIVVQNALYNLGSSFNQAQQVELSSVKPTNQYQLQKVTTTTPRINLVNRKSTTATPHVTTKPIFSSNSNNNDEIFKGSHSSNFYSHRNSNDDDDDYKRSSVTNAAKTRHRTRGRAHYRGTPATTTTTTTTSTTFKPPVVQNYTTFVPLISKSTTPSPFKFTFSSTTQPIPISSNAHQVNPAQLGPLQQQYQQSNYNHNNFAHFNVQSSTALPAPSTQRNNFRAGSFNNLVTTQSTFNEPQRQVVSSPTPFNTNHLNANNNPNGKLTSNNIPFTNSNVYNNNLFNSNPSNVSRPIGRVFDNHNVINNYQTTSPFSKQRTIENHIPAHNTILRLAQTQANHFVQPIVASNVQKPTNNSFYQPISVSAVQPSITTPPQIARNSLPSDRPNFNQQDIINQFNSEQRRFSQAKSSQTAPQQNNNVQNNRRPDAQTYLSLEQKRLQLHYDINDYLTTDKYSTKYSPTSEQYRSVQTISTSSLPQTTQSNQFLTQKYYDSIYSTTPKVIKPQFDSGVKYQTQQDRPAQTNQPFKFNSQTNDRIVQTTPQSINVKPSINNNNVVLTSTKKFSTLVPKENYAPTTFKPQFYFNVAKQINDNLSTPVKLKSVTAASTATATVTATYSTTSTTSRSIPITPIFNRNPEFLAYNTPTNKPQSQPQVQSLPQIPFQSFKANVSGIDENYGQYHPELYEKDFARYKIKSRKKQQHVIQNTLKQNFAKPQNDFSANKFQQNVNRGSQKPFGTSSEEEFLNTAHSQNIAASGNELWAKQTNSKNAAKQTFNTPQKAPTIPPNATTKQKPIIPKDDKDVSYDYAYYDSGNDAPHDYSEFDLSDFGKTRRQ